LLLVSLGIIAALAAGPTVAATTRVTSFLTGTQVNVRYAGATAYASSSVPFQGNIANVIDSLTSANDADDLAFYLDTDTDGRIAITGFNSAFNDIRIFTASADAGHRPGDYAIAVRCSLKAQTAKSALLASSYERSLGTIPKAWSYTYYDTGASATGRGYYDFPVWAPPGTQSVFFDFGATNGFVRIYEIELITTSGLSPSKALVRGKLITDNYVSAICLNGKQLPVPEQSEVWPFDRFAEFSVTKSFFEDQYARVRRGQRRPRGRSNRPRPDGIAG
jgi:hypothetical protein